ncbi:hypothetical protein WA026_011720 [Henosepilachna vigintioctopunctata]|uniref:PNPLA domain-containing protein n=1 Tax=Henosepilachna vigintioctopunctata TaxID=420089 RepID=A0AAW1UIW3_9CUCU
MPFNHEKLFDLFKTSLPKIFKRKGLSITLRKDLSRYIDKLQFIKHATGNLQSIMLTSVLRNSFSSELNNSAKLKSFPNLDANISSKIIQEANIPKKEPQNPLWSIGISKLHIISQIRHILTSIEDAQTELSFQGRIEALISYIYRHPEARILSVKEGAIKILLNARRKYKNKDQAALREALSVLGYADPVPMKGIRILSIDGGGIRGLLVIEMLKKLEELTGKRTYELFDLFCGTSTGAILAFSMGIYHKSLDEIAQIYLDISNEVFKQSALWGTGNLVWSQSYYSTPLWEKNLKKYLGDIRLMETARDPLCPKICTVSAVVNQSHLSAYLFRNYSLPQKIQSQYFGSFEHKVWEAVRASAAAPTCFEEFKLGDFIHQDGGILVNNPTAIAIHEAKLLWPNQPIQCVVSFGTGRTVPTNFKQDNTTDTASLNTSWKNKFFKILDSATDTEGVHTMLNDLLPDHIYYRFNPYLMEMVSMVEIEEKKIEQLKRDALMYLRRNEDKFHAAAKALSESKNYMQRSSDWINCKRDMYGF